MIHLATTIGLITLTLQGAGTLIMALAFFVLRDLRDRITRLEGWAMGELLERSILEKHGGR